MSIQQRLLQREPLDPWSLREQLCLSSAVCRSGDQNWMSVSRAMRAAGDPARPADWYQQKYCATQYGALLEAAETPKRKKRTSEGAAETPQDAILKRLTAERIAELQKLMQESKTQYAVLKEEISEVQSPGTSDARIRELLAGVEAARRQREREQQRQAQWLRDREECRRRAADKSRCVPVTPPAGVSSPPACSPLLTSLLKNVSPGGSTAPSVSVSHVLHVPHPATIYDAVSPSASAPTLSMLLEKGREGVAALPPPVPTTADAAVIEQIKSELQEIEKNLQMGNMAQTTPPLLAAPPPPPPSAAPALDIDDIEIKAEDVYAFSDMHLEIQPVSSIHKATLARSIEKPLLTKCSDGEEVHTADVPPEEQSAPVVEIKEEQLEAAAVVPEQTQDVQQAGDVEETATAEEAGEEATQNWIGNEHCLKRAIIYLTPPAPEASEVPTPALAEQKEAESERDVGPPPLVAEPTGDEQSSADEGEEVNVTGISEVDLPPHESFLDQQEVKPQPPESQDVKEEPASETEGAEPVEERNDTIAHSPDAHKNEDQDWEPAAESVDAGGAPEVVPGAADEKPSEAEETHTETDDDTPMEVIREEEKDGRKRRDYSRRKAQLPSESRGCSGSESAAESAPASPAPSVVATPVATPAPDPDRDHRLWKKSVMLVYNRLCAHKYASLFLRPITDDLAPDYSIVVRRPMDFTTIKRNIDSGVIRTTAEFQRDVLLMLSNALFYNSSRHRVHHMAQEMHQEAAAQLGMLLQAQAHAALADSHAEPPARRPHPAAKRKRLSSPHLAGAASPLAKRPREE